MHEARQFSFNPRPHARGDPAVIDETDPLQTNDALSAFNSGEDKKVGNFKVDLTLDPLRRKSQLQSQVPVLVQGWHGHDVAGLSVSRLR